MAFVDFSDPADMLELLVEYVTDELSEADEPERRRFLSALLEPVALLQEGSGTVSTAESLRLLRELHAGVDPEFADDPVAQHLADCAAELERLDERH